MDAAQAAGSHAVDVQALQCDAMALPGHKAMFSLAGAGFLYVKEDMIDEVRPPYGAKFSYTSNDRMQPEPRYAPDAHRFEYGNPNFLGCWVQKRSAEWLQAIGLHHIEARIRVLSTYLIEEADRRGIRVRTPRRWEERAAIVSFELPGNAAEIVNELRRRRICVSEKDGHLRASLHFYNNRDDLDRLLDSVPGP